MVNGELLMKVFVSWSGDRSREVGTTLSIWMRDIFPDVDPWMSAHDIHAGTSWGQELNSGLELSNFGVLCLTPENISAPWILFEAGALAKASTIARVVPYLFGFSHSNIGYPLAQFQRVLSDEQGTRQLFESINRTRDSPLEDERLRRLFTKWCWPELETTLKAIPPFAGTEPPASAERELLEAILEFVRPRPTEPTTPTANIVHADSSHVAEVRIATETLRSRSTSARASFSGLAKAEEYAVNKLREGTQSPDVVAGLERRGVRKRLAQDMVKQLERDLGR